MHTRRANIFNFISAHANVDTYSNSHSPPVQDYLLKERILSCSRNHARKQALHTFMYIQNGFVFVTISCKKKEKRKEKHRTHKIFMKKTYGNVKFRNVEIRNVHRRANTRILIQQPWKSNGESKAKEKKHETYQSTIEREKKKGVI